MWEGVNRRKFPRASYPCLVIIRKDHKEPVALLTHTENVGLGGICVILKKSLDLFMPVELEIDLMDTHPHIKCEGKIVWAIRRKETEEQKPSFFDTGIEFVRMKEDDRNRISIVVDRLMKLESE